MRGSLLMLAGIHSTASIVDHSNCGAGQQVPVDNASELKMGLACTNAFDNDEVRVCSG
jgi:hypothetical protein